MSIPPHGAVAPTSLRHDPLRPTFVEVDLSAISHNVATIGRTSSADVCAVVKADGYGHGAIEAARAAVDGGAAWLAVALVEEGEELRDAGIDRPILVLAEPPVEAAGRLVAAGLTAVTYTAGLLDALAVYGTAEAPVEVHVKADTGMHRVGVPRDNWTGFLDHVIATPGVRVTGLMTHLARADEPGEPTTDRQLDAFEDFVVMARRRGIEPDHVHAANTAGALMWPRARHTMVRAGIGIYGLSPSDEVRAADHGLRPALTWRTRVSFAKRLREGDAASYGHRWAAPANGWLATLPVGYADGIPRVVGGRLDVLVNGRRKALVGTVCMDQVVVWCGEDEVARDDEVVLLGAAGGPDGPQEVSADDWAAAASTITYEITCGLQKRVPRIHLQTGGRDGTGTR